MALLWNPRSWGISTQDYKGMHEHDGRLRLTDDQVRELRKLHSEQGWSFVRLAQHFNISPRQASNVARRLSRAGVPDHA